MKLILKNSELILRAIGKEYVKVGPTNENLLAYTQANSGDFVHGYKAANADCGGANINRVTKINFRVSDGGDGVNRGGTKFFKMTIEDNVCTGMVEVASYTYNASDEGNIVSLDVNVELGENEYIALGGNFYYSSIGGAGTLNAHGAGETIEVLATQYSGYNIEGYKYIVD